MNRGSWFLVQAYDPPTEDSESATVAENTGYIVFKDRKTEKDPITGCSSTDFTDSVIFLDRIITRWLILL